MSQLLTLEYCILKEKMDTTFEDHQHISSVDIFDIYVHTLSQVTNVLKEEDLKPLVFNQFKVYGDFDKTMNAVSQNVTDIHKSTQDAITAIDSNDSSALKSAYSQLKNYQKRIHELEEDMYKDDTTGLYNRKYLFNHELDDKEACKYNGILLHLSVNNFQQINKEHGHDAGDVVLKFVSKLLQKNLNEMGVHLVRYMGVQFVAVAKESVSTKAQKIFQETVDMVLSKKFKTHAGEVLTIELQLNQKVFEKGQSFQKVYESL